MSSPPKNNNASPPVVQSILESFTRCFNPLEPCTKVCSSNDGSSAIGAAASRKSNSSSPLFGLAFGSRTGDTNKSSSQIPPSVSHSSSASESRRRNYGQQQQHQQQQQQNIQLDVSYDADGVARAKKIHHRISSEALEERATKRKLEIFRGMKEGSSSSSGGPPRRQHSSSGGGGGRRSNNKFSPPPPSSAGHSPHMSDNARLALSDDEEELIRLQTQSRKRFACGMNMDRFSQGVTNNGSSPISSVARLFNFNITDAQKQRFGLCFATPVRTSSEENVAAMSDDKLTDEEFLSRHHHRAGASLAVSPDDRDGEDHSSYNEDETISSTLYFDNKYSHVVQTRPPMPLFQEDLVGCGESGADELSKIIKRRSATKKKLVAMAGGGQNKKSSGSPPMELITSSMNQQRMRGNNNPKGIGNDGSNMDQHQRQRRPPSPLKIRDESLSVNTGSVESVNSTSEEMVHRFREPDVMHATAAEF